MTCSMARMEHDTVGCLLTRPTRTFLMYETTLNVSDGEIRLFETFAVSCSRTVAKSGLGAVRGTRLEESGPYQRARTSSR